MIFKFAKNIFCLLILISIEIVVCDSQTNELGNGKNILAQPNQEKVIMCYWATWAFYKPDYAKFDITEFDPFLCTHIIYSFTGLSPRTWRLVCLDPNLDLKLGDINAICNENKTSELQHGFISKTVDWRDKNNPGLKLLIAFGGWDEGSINYSNMAKDPNKRRTFITSIMAFLNEYKGFDGVDVDWEYPTQRGGVPEDKVNFSIFLKELKDALNKAETETKKYTLSSAVGAGKYMVETAYDVPEISKYLDYINLMLYDFKMYLPSSTKIGHHSPLYPKAWEDEDDKALTIKEAVENFINLGAPKEKLVMGVGAYGKTFQLFNRSQHNFYDEAKGPGAPYRFSQQAGTITYYEICGEMEQTSSSKFSYSFDYQYYSAYAYSDTTWVGYDDEISAAGKVDFMKEKDLAGMMIWTIDYDDCTNKCKGWYNCPIVSAVRNRLSFHYPSMLPAKRVEIEASKNLDFDENLI